LLTGKNNSMADRNKVKLLILTPSLQCGGSEKFVSLICNHINNNLFSVCLLVISNSKAFYEIENRAVEIIDLKKTRVLFSLMAIKKEVNKFNPDIVFSTANHLNLYLAIFKSRFNRKIKFVGREANMVSINSREAKMPVLYRWLIRKYYNRFDLLICQGQEMLQDLVLHFNIPPRKTVVIHNATPPVTVNNIPAGNQNTE
jgi:glycosyltransferase involved in cell wall biosynthesis